MAVAKKISMGTFRVYRLPKSLRVACAKTRTVTDQTVAAFVQSAIESELPGLLGDLRVVFHGRHAGPKGPCRLAISDLTLATLKKASGVSLPATLLLELCLSRAAAKGVKPRRGRQKAR
jgi:hypothetical protein